RPRAEASPHAEMSGGVTRGVFFAIAILTAASLFGQESQVASDLRREAQDIRDGCASGFSAKALVGCVIVLTTDDPFHVAFGNLARQNGMGCGLAFAQHYRANERWRISWNPDGIVLQSV